MSITIYADKRPFAEVKVQNKNYHFTKTAYFQAAKESQPSLFQPPADRVENARESAEAISVTVAVGGTIGLTYAKPSWSQFSQKYSSEGWFGRKVALLFDLLLESILLVIHVVRLIFVRFPKAIVATFVDVDVTPFEARGHFVRSEWSVDAFHVLRDLEYIAGTIVTLFSDKLGSYIREDAIFHKEMYALQLELIRP